MPEPLRVLLLEDSPDDAEMLERELKRAGFAPSTPPDVHIAVDPKWLN